MAEGRMSERGVWNAKIKKRLIDLRATVLKPDGSEHSLGEIARHVSAATEDPVSRQLVSKWFNPALNNLPTEWQLPHVAAFFAVAKEFFTDDEAHRTIMKEIADVIALRNVTKYLNDEDTQVLRRDLGDFTPEQAKKMLAAVQQIKAESDAADSARDSRAKAVPLPAFRPPRRES
ncbi:hypothetical protein BS329_38750 [Amycolatopsis coloradensis]|uniref:Uncharacterized protein n=1 Tax=Amycolatopsis coloradensis TaxID=76021 RepID=A0A1R0KEL0_9PSEU|nr:hypothetical protein BS329_38750 [Amycolatopsis coloradensis]